MAVHQIVYSEKRVSGSFIFRARFFVEKRAWLTWPDERPTKQRCERGSRSCYGPHLLRCGSYDGASAMTVRTMAGSCYAPFTPVFIRVVYTGRLSE